MSTEQLAEDLITFTRMLRPGRRPDMTPEPYWLLRHLRSNGPASMSELAHALNITTGSATVACKRLEKAGLVTRERMLDDERIVQVALTTQGQAQFDERRQRKRAALMQLLDTLDAQEQEELQRIIERLLHNAEAQGFGVDWS